jgi:Tol biopolymer transport system component
MKPQERLVRWIDGEEEELDLAEDNPIPSDIKPTVAIESLSQDSPVQAKLRAELKSSGLKVCYQSRRNGGSDLYVMDANGSNSVNITRTPAIDEVYPHVSRDGRRVCFTIVRSEQLSDTKTVPRFDVYWMNMNGSDRTLVAEDATDPCWDPTGSLVAFVKRLSPQQPRNYHNTGLFAHDIHTNKAKELTGGKLYHAYVPCWSPMGNWIVVTVHKYAELEHALIAFELSTRKMHVLKQSGIDGCRPDLSWDGECICWNANNV